VRQALHHAIDRQVLIDVATHGLAPVADSWIPPSSPYRRELEPSIPQFPYDPQRAQTLLAQAGWNRGADGTLVHSPSGERFEIQLIDTPATGSLKDTLLIADFWKALGIDAKGMAMPAALEGDREFRSKQPGMVTGRAGYVDYEVDRLHGRFISSAANRWSGRNNSGYNNPRVDVILDQLNVVIDPRQRIPLQRQLLQEQMGDIGFMPFYFDVFPVLQLKEVKGNLTAANSGWNAFEWDKE
jgi:peptide/nickel transport system substrate-binding protein